MGCGSSKEEKPAERSHRQSASRAVQQMVHVHDGAAAPMVESVYEGGPWGDGDDAKPIGTGGTSSVYPVTHKETGRKYALKVIEMQRLSKSRRQQLLLEVDIMRLLDHPHIVRIHEVFKTEFTLYIVMEYCTGGELFEELAQCPQMQMEEKKYREIARTILSALAYLHSNGIAHRDLKLENFIFTSVNPKTRMLKMIDFGYSRAFLEGDVMRSVVGTAYYIAPEVLDGAYTQEADLWSLGVMVYMMATGEIPIPGKDDEDVMCNVLKAKHRGTKFGSRAGRRVPLSAEAEDFINKLMTVDPNVRLTAEGAMQHPWITSEALTPKDVELKEKQLEDDIADAAHNIKAFRSFGILKKLALVAISVHLESEALIELESIFTAMDVDHTGTISFDEFLAGLNKTSIPKSEVEAMFASVDQEHTGHVNYTEFIAACASEKLLVDQRNLISAFNALDIDGNGTISKSELRKLLGPEVNEVALDNLIAQCDFHKDGVITKEEFVRGMRGEKVGDTSVKG